MVDKSGRRKSAADDRGAAVLIRVYPENPQLMVLLKPYRNKLRNADFLHRHAI